MVDRNGTRNDQRKELEKRRRTRNWALFAILMGLVVLFYVVTIVRMGGS